MTLCPIALGVGCKKCPIVNICLVKGIVGDFKAGKGRPGKKPGAPARKGRATRGK